MSKLIRITIAGPAASGKSMIALVIRDALRAAGIEKIEYVNETGEELLLRPPGLLKTVQPTIRIEEKQLKKHGW